MTDKILFNKGHGPDIYCSTKRPEILWVPIGFLFNGSKNYFPGSKRPGHVPDRSFPYSTGVKNNWSHTSILLYVFIARKVTDSHITSVLNKFTPRNNPEDGRIQFNRGESIRSCIYLIKYICSYHGDFWS
jgi:hypothetical protein